MSLKYHYCTIMTSYVLLSPMNNQAIDQATVMVSEWPLFPQKETYRCRAFSEDSIPYSCTHMVGRVPVLSFGQIRQYTLRSVWEASVYLLHLAELLSFRGQSYSMNSQGDDSPNPPTQRKSPQPDSPWTTSLFPPFGLLLDGRFMDRSGIASHFKTVCKRKICVIVRMVDSSQSKEGWRRSANSAHRNEFACCCTEETAFSLGWCPSHPFLAAVI